MAKPIVIAGVDVGRKLADGLFAEEVGAGRFVIRKLENVDGDVWARRLGEVFGSGKTFQACRMKGETIAVKSSLIKAAQALIAP